MLASGSFNILQTFLFQVDWTPWPAHLAELWPRQVREAEFWLNITTTRLIQEMCEFSRHIYICNYDRPTFDTLSSRIQSRMWRRPTQQVFDICNKWAAACLKHWSVSQKENVWWFESTLTDVIVNQTLKPRSASLQGVTASRSPAAPPSITSLISHTQTHTRYTLTSV